jgi:2'-5' RNA ligase
MISYLQLYFLREYNFAIKIKGVGMRLFIASPVRIINYEEIRRRFTPLIEGRWVFEENLHLTWAFLGEYPESDLSQIAARLQAVKGLSASVKLRGLGSFGRPAKILYASAKERSLYKKASQLRAVGFENRRFHPHVTLCRIKKIIKKEKFFEALHAFEGVEIGEIESAIHLYQSILRKEGAHYRILE